MKALSIRQPWAWAILHAGKDVENRTWQTFYRGPLLVHAPKGFDMPGKKWMLSQGIAVPGNLTRGGIVGRVRLVDCVTSLASPWFQGPFGFVLEAPEEIQFYNCVGRLGLFDAPLQEAIGL